MMGFFLNPFIQINSKEKSDMSQVHAIENKVFSSLSEIKVLSFGKVILYEKNTGLSQDPRVLISDI